MSHRFRTAHHGAPSPGAAPAQTSARHHPGTGAPAAAATRRKVAAAPSPGPATAKAYTFAHAGRQFRLGPLAFWTLAFVLAVMAVWSAATATYFAFRDDLLTRLIARQQSAQVAYEDRISELRAQVDRLTSRQLLDQEQFEQKLDQLVRRQATLESRATMLEGLSDPTPGGNARRHTPQGGSARNAPANGEPKPSPINDTVILVPPPDREASLESRDLPLSAGRLAGTGTGTGFAATLTRLKDSLDRVEADQSVALTRLEERYDSRVHKMRSVLVDLGLDLAHLAPAGPAGATGGPYIPVTPNANASPFERQVYRIHLVRARLDRLNRSLVSVPIRRPLEGELETSSGFGVRMDPFLRSPAMHTGLDFRGAFGERVRATAGGKVVQAGWNGGYGKMVEIDHGNGLSTRYAHLSAIDVEEGQTVRIGQTVGRIGTTGRSTGPHLHYETRVGGEPVNPQKFLRAAIRLGTF